MPRAALYPAYLLLALAAGAVIGLYGGWAAGCSGGSLAFLFCLQLHGMALRLGDRKTYSAEIARLRRAGSKLEQRLSETKAQMDDMSKAFEAQNKEANRKIVSELKMLEGLMREFAGRIAHKATTQPGGKPEQGGDVTRYFESFSAPELLETIRSSLEENRVDLYLQPIVSLPQRKLRYYEALSRLRSADGKLIMPAQYIRVAGPAGLMSVVDNLLLFRCVQIVRRLIKKNRSIGVFCNISGETLRDVEFFPQFLEYMQHHKDLAPNIIFEFAQGAVLGADGPAEANLKYLSSLGFALSMDHAQNLSLDFAKLRDVGFRHIKLRAQTLTGGMQGAGALVAVEDIKALLARYGLNLIAERVEDEKTVVQLLDYGVDFAQGYLFGEPRAVRGDVLGHDHQIVPNAGLADGGTGAVIPLRQAG
jgi:cyclic-di-GMP phosphodiesterase, flagellum assembly factor TipF